MSILVTLLCHLFCQVEISPLLPEQAAEALEGPQRPVALKVLVKNCHRLSTEGALRAVATLSAHCEPEAFGCGEALLGSLAGQMSSLGASVAMLSPPFTSKGPYINIYT